MVFTQSSPSPVPPLSFAQPPTPQRLHQINMYLDQLLLALVALTDLDESTWRQALKKVPSSPTNSNFSTPNYPVTTPAAGEINLQQIRTLAMAIAYLSHHYQELLRRSVNLTEQTTEQGKNPLQTALLGEYGQKLQGAWQRYKTKQGSSVPLLTEDRILSLLTELFFYSSQDGSRRLWRVLENTEFPPNSEK